MVLVFDKQVTIVEFGFNKSLFGNLLFILMSLFKFDICTFHLTIIIYKYTFKKMLITYFINYFGGGNVFRLTGFSPLVRG